MKRLASAVNLSLVLALFAFATPQLAAADAVSQVVTVKVKSGELEEYRSRVKKLSEVMERLGSNGKVRMWNTTVGGPDTGTVIVGIEYPSASAWATDTAKAANDEEWQDIISGLDEIRTVEANSVWRDISPAAASATNVAPGGVLAIIGVQPKPGKLDAYLDRIAKSRSISDRVGHEGRIRIWQADVAGPNTGSVVVGLEYSDLPSYMKNQDKLAKDAEWSQFIAGLDEVRSVGGRWLYQEITP